MPGSATELVNFIAQYLNVYLSAQIQFFNYGSATPSPENTDKPWMKTDTSGKPLGWFVYYNGEWRRELAMPVGSIIDYVGPTAGVFDATGRGLKGGEWDGWALANGQNGTKDFRDLFAVGASSYDPVSGWVTTVSGESTTKGGEAFHKMTIEELVPHVHPIKQFNRTQFDGDGDPGWGARNPDRYTDTEPTGEGKPFPILPPYVASPKVQCIGYL